MSPEAVTSAFCWSHARRRFFELADIAGNARRGKNAAVISPIALEAVRCIDALFAIERGINGLSAAERLDTRKRESAPLLTDLEAWLHDQRWRLAGRAAAAGEPHAGQLRGRPLFCRLFVGSRIYVTIGAQRALRGFALGRRSWLFAGSERGAERATVIATLIMTAKLNDVDPQAWLADVLARIPHHPVPAPRRASPLAMGCPRQGRSRGLSVPAITSYPSDLTAALAGWIRIFLQIGTIKHTADRAGGSAEEHRCLAQPRAACATERAVAQRERHASYGESNACALGQRQPLASERGCEEHRQQWERGENQRGTAGRNCLQTEVQQPNDDAELNDAEQRDGNDVAALETKSASRERRRQKDWSRSRLGNRAAVKSPPAS